MDIETDNKVVNFFKHQPINTISQKYIDRLSDEDKFYFLQAVRERSDRKFFEPNILITIDVVTRLGLFSVF